MTAAVAAGELSRTAGMAKLAGSGVVYSKSQFNKLVATRPGLSPLPKGREGNMPRWFNEACVDYAIAFRRVVKISLDEVTDCLSWCSEGTAR